MKSITKKETTRKKVAASRKSWYNDYMSHEFAQYRMTFLEYKKLRQEGKIK